MGSANAARRRESATRRAAPSWKAKLALVLVGVLLPLALAELVLQIAGAILPGDYQTVSFAEAHPEFGRRNKPGAGWKKTSEYTSWIEVNSKGLQRRRDRLPEAGRRGPHPGDRRLVHLRRAGQPAGDVHPAPRRPPQRRGHGAEVPGAERRIERLGDRQRGRLPDQGRRAVPARRRRRRALPRERHLGQLPPRRDSPERRRGRPGAARRRRLRRAAPDPAQVRAIHRLRVGRPGEAALVARRRRLQLRRSQAAAHARRGRGGLDDHRAPARSDARRLGEPGRPLRGDGRAVRD